MLWVTRENVHVDRVACPWLIKRFVDTRAQFVFLPKPEVADFSKKTGAVQFDMGGDAELDHHKCGNEDHCTFDAIVEKHKLQDDEALERVRKLVRAADTDGLQKEPRAWVLEIVGTGVPLLTKSDQESLEKEFPVYDALYAYFQQEIIREKYKSDIEKFKTRGEARDFIKQKMLGLKSRALR